MSWMACKLCEKEGDHVVHKGNMRSVHISLTGLHLFDHRGKYWAGLRASCERVFHSGQLASYAPLMNSAAEKLTARFQRAHEAAAESSRAFVGSASDSPEVGVSGGLATSAAQEPGTAAGPKGGSPQAVSLNAALATMTLEVIGTSAFG